MSGYLIRRILFMVPTLLGVAVLVFVLMRLIPGDIVSLRLAGEGGVVSAEALAAERARLGLDRPQWLQLVEWLGGLARFDFGISMWTGRPISYEIGLRFHLSLQIAVMSTLLATMLAIPLGAIAAVKQGTWIDYGVRLFAIAGLATPSFWLGILIILFLLIQFDWMPPIHFVPIWVDPIQNLSQLIWPAMATGYRYSAVAMRMTRSAVLEVMREDYIRTARAKGLLEKSILMRHALKNAMLPVVTVIGLEFAFLLGGLVVTEQVFNLNGLGMLFVRGVENHDYTLVQALVMLVATVFILTNFFVDLLYVWLDPRIRLD